MSTLTKILIVLLTISSIFLCGIVVTYVANADNYRDQYNKQRADRDGLQENVASLTEQLNNKIAEKDDLGGRLSREIASLKVQVNKLQGQLKDVERRNNQLLNEVASYASASETYSQTAKEMTQLLKDAQARLTKVDAERIKLIAQFDDTSETLLEKFAIIQTLQTEKKQLLEEKVELLSRMDRLLQPVGRAPAPVVTVTRPREIARPAPVIVKDIALRGLVTAVDLKNKMASISIGTADGVKEGMKFHVTRGDRFICDILIIDTDAEEAVGALELLDLAREQPRAGDTVTINF